LPWLNVDISLKTCTYHGDDSCSFVFEKRGTEFKGLGTLRRDGGWLQFDRYYSASRFHKEHLNDFKLI
jgi:hypothetical protein